MFDHVTLRVPDLPLATGDLSAVLDELEIPQTTDTPSFAAWGNFGIMHDPDRPITAKIHLAFIAATHGHVDRFWQAGIDAGFADDGGPGPRPNYADDYYAAFLKDAAGNSFEAVHRDGERPGGNIDHVALRVSDVEASTAFYSTIGAAAGLTVRRRGADRTAFSLAGPGGSLGVIAGDPTLNCHLAFSGDDDAVRRFHAEAIAAGYASNGEPGERPVYHPGYYASFVFDPDGNNIEVVSHTR